MTLVELICKWVEECGSSVDSCSPLGSVGCRVLIIDHLVHTCHPQKSWGSKIWLKKLTWIRQP